MTQNINIKIEKSTHDTYPSILPYLYVEKEEITNGIKYKVKGHYIKSKKKKKTQSPNIIENREANRFASVRLWTEHSAKKVKRKCGTADIGVRKHEGAKERKLVAGVRRAKQ